MSARLSGLLIVALACGCGVPLEDSADSFANQCGSDSDCGSGGVCRSGRCVSTKAQLSDLRIEVQLPTSSPYGAGTSSLIRPAADGMSLQGTRAGGYLLSYDLNVPEVVQVTGVYLIPEPRPTEPPCTFVGEGMDWPQDGSLPVTAEFHPTSQPVGLPLEPYSSTSLLVAEGGSITNEFSLQVPQGTYDIYVTVDRAQVTGCEYPPVLLREKTLVDQSVQVTVGVQQPTLVAGAVEGVQDLQWPLKDWTLELLDPDGGRRISTRFVFGTSTTTDRLPFQGIAFFEELSTGALIRLAPPAEALGLPTFVWQLSAVNPLGDLSDIRLDIQDFANVTPLSVAGWVAAKDDGAPMGARISIQSIELLDGAFGANASYKTTAEAGADGAFETTLLPGTYRITAVPGGSEHYAITAETWLVSEGGSGQTIEVHPKPTLAGSVSTPLGAPAHDVPVYLQPSTAPAVSYLQSIVETFDVPPNGASGLTDASGGFTIPVDPGGFDVAVRPGQSTGYPWLVRANVTILEPSDGPASAQLGNLVVSNPVVLTGSVRSPLGEALPGAIIRGWLPLPQEGDRDETQTTVIQIAETVADGRGAYVLDLPVSISQ